MCGAKCQLSGGFPLRLQRELTLQCVRVWECGVGYFDWSVPLLGRTAAIGCGVEESDRGESGMGMQ